MCRTRYELSMASDPDMENGDGQVSIMIHYDALLSYMPACTCLYVCNP